MSDDPKRETPIELTALAIIGWILPLAGLVWGPGEWWQYVIWLGLGTVALVVYDRMHPSSDST